MLDEPTLINDLHGADRRYRQGGGTRFLCRTIEEALAGGMTRTAIAGELMRDMDEIGRLVSAG